MEKPAIVENPLGLDEIILEWDEEVIDHILKHSIEKLEIESIFKYKFHPIKRKNFVDILGRTIGGRILFVVLENISKNKFKVSFARDATRSEKNLYKRKVK